MSPSMFNLLMNGVVEEVKVILKEKAARIVYEESEEGERKWDVSVVADTWQKSVDHIAGSC